VKVTSPKKTGRGSAVQVQETPEDKWAREVDELIEKENPASTKAVK